MLKQVQHDKQHDTNLKIFINHIIISIIEEKWQMCEKATEKSVFCR